MNKKREEMKKNLKKGFNRRGYENDLLESLKKARSSSTIIKHHKSGERGGR